MGKGQLLLKVIGQDIGKLKRFSGKYDLGWQFVPKKDLHLYLPKDVATFDFVKGFSPKKGNFRITSFKNAEGKIVRREISYTDLNKYIVNNYDYSEKFGLRGRSVSTMVDEGKNYINTKSNLFDFGSYFKLEEIANDKHTNQTVRIARFEAGKTPKQVSWITSKDNPVPNKFEIKGIRNKISQQDAEYLPILLGSIQRYDKKAEYLAEVNTKRLGLKGIVPEIETESIYLMTKDFSAEGLTSPFTGKIKIGYTSEKDLVDCVGHEFQHARDFSDMYRVESNANEYINNADMQNGLEKMFPGSKKFINGSIQRGIILDNSEQAEYLNIIGDEINDYKNLCNKLGHDNLLCEKRAINAGLEEQQKYSRALNWVKRNLGFAA